MDLSYAVFLEDMKDFPCLFNVNVKKPNSIELERLRDTLEKERDEEFDEEKKMKFNIQSWIYFELGNLEKALESNDQARRECMKPDISTRGNRAFIEFYKEGKTNETDCLKCLKSEKEESFETMVLDGRCEQAYFLYRLGGKLNLERSRMIYDDLERQKPQNYLWKYLKAVVTRRFESGRRTPDFPTLSLIYELFESVAKESKNLRLKCIALAHMAQHLACDKRHSTESIKRIVEEALEPDFDNEKTNIKCGQALLRRNDMKAFELFKKTVKNNKTSSRAHFLLAKGYQKLSMQSKVEKNLMKVYELSKQPKLRAILDLAWYYCSKGDKHKSYSYYELLTKNWFLKGTSERFSFIERIYEKFYFLLKEINIDIDPAFKEKILTMAILLSLELFKKKSTPENRFFVWKQLFTEISDIRQVIFYSKQTKHLYGLLEDDHEGARQILMKMGAQNELESKDRLLVELQRLMDANRPGEAILLVDLLALNEGSQISHQVDKDILDVMMTKEARWRLENGFVACKSLFRRLFNLRYSNAHRPQEPDNRSCDVIILHDSHIWDPPLGKFPAKFKDISKRNSCECEDVIEYVFDLEVMVNPSLTSSKSANIGSDGFKEFLCSLGAKVLLVLVCEDTSESFLDALSFIGAPKGQDDFLDMAIIKYGSQGLPDNCLKDVRVFSARENHFGCHDDPWPLQDISGTQIIDQYFSRDIDNVFRFFDFLAPAETVTDS